MTRDRAHLLPSAIGAFWNQTHRNKELILVYEADDRATHDFVALLGGHTERKNAIVASRLATAFGSVTALKVPKTPHRTLGDLRNLAIEAAHGAFIMQWDDDDIYCATRIQTQLAALDSTQKSACVLDSWLVHDAATDSVYRSVERPLGWEGSLLCERRHAVRYLSLPRAEDTPVIERLFREEKLCVISAPNIYVYRIHSTNTWNREHFQYTLEHSTRLSGSALQKVRQLALNNVSMFRRVSAGPRGSEPPS